MSQILETLFSAMSPDHQMEAEYQAVQASKEAVRAAEKHLTNDEFDNLWNAIANIDRGETLDNFTLGFRLGVQLTLEGLRPIDWIAP